MSGPQAPPQALPQAAPVPRHGEVERTAALILLGVIAFMMIVTLAMVVVTHQRTIHLGLQVHHLQLLVNDMCRYRR